VYDLPPTDLGNYVAGIKELLNHLAGQTRTPPHYLIGQMVNVSGEALAAAESGLVNRVEAKQSSFGISWREVLSLAGIDGKIEVVWKNPERISLAAAADAANKLALPALGIAREWIWANVLGMSPLEIEEMKKQPAAANTQIDGTAATGGDTTTQPPPDTTPPPPAQ
jgi:Phage portal protein, SPP1 Gp6-like